MIAIKVIWCMLFHSRGWIGGVGETRVGTSDYYYEEFWCCKCETFRYKVRKK